MSIGEGSLQHAEASDTLGGLQHVLRHQTTPEDMQLMVRTTTHVGGQHCEQPFTLDPPEAPVESGLMLNASIRSTTA